jgi:hypothetical protein
MMVLVVAKKGRGRLLDYLMEFLASLVISSEPRSRTKPESLEHAGPWRRWRGVRNSECQCSSDN